MDRLLQDLRFAIRSLRKSPALVAVATLSLALGIAVNVTIFAGVDILLFRPIPYPDAGRLIHLWSNRPSQGWTQASVSLPDFFDWREQSRTAELVGYHVTRFNLADAERPERITAMQVSPDFFRIMGATVALGRGFTAEAETVGQDRVVVLTDRLWRDRFRGDPGVVGRALKLDGEPYTVAGVLRPGFSFNAKQTALYTPLARSGQENRGNHYLRVLGRLRPGSTIEAARSELSGIARRLEQLHPTTNNGMGVTVISLQDEIIEPQTRQGGVICIVAVVFVLLIGCANVANLLLARATARSRELAVRAAMGAGRGRLLRQLLTESVVLATIGGVLGVLLSILGIRWLGSLIPTDFPRLEQLRLEPRALFFAAGITVLSALVFGSAPALQATRTDLNRSLRDGGRTGTAGARHGRLRALLVSSEMALALVLLISAGLLIKATLRLQLTHLGFDSSNTLTFGVALAKADYPDSVAVVDFQEQLRRKLMELPGVVAAGATSDLPLTGSNSVFYAVEGQDPGEGNRPTVTHYDVSPGFLEVLGVPVVRGRGITPGDRFGAPRVALVNQAFVQRHWPNGVGDPVGKRILVSRTRWEIAGVVRDFRAFGPDDPAPALVFFPAAQDETRAITFALRTRGDPGALAGAARQAVAQLAPGQPVYDVRTMAELIRQENAGDTILAKLLGLFGAIALLLAVMGVYGVMSYSVAQRTQELGVRRALGAQPGAIVGLVVRQGLVICGLGALAGLGLAALLSRGLSAFLYGVSAFDPAVFGGVTAALLAAACVAMLVPARRATGVDPLVALRAE